MRLFVGNLPYDVTEVELREFFSSIGPLSTVIIPVDRETGKRRGFAFIEFNDPAKAEEASRLLNNQPFKGRNITINEARARESRPDFGASGRPSFSSRPTGTYGARPLFNPRSSAGGPGFAPDGVESGRGGRAERRGRNFGADAKPSRKRRTDYGSRNEMGWKRGPLRERAGGQLFGDLEDDDYGEDDDFDYLADFREPRGEEDEEGAK